MPADKIAGPGRRPDLTLTNLAKVLYPADGFTKAEVLDYYQRISARAAAARRGAPDDAQALPGRRGRASPSSPSTRPPGCRTGCAPAEIVQQLPVPAPGDTISTWCIDDLPSLIWAANLAALELHVPMWRFPDPAAPGAAPEHGGLRPARLRPRPRARRPRSLTAAGWPRRSARLLADDGLDAAAQDLGRQGAATLRGRQTGA